MRVTYSSILPKVKSTTYTVLPDGRTTICQLTMNNGFTIEGSSVYSDPSEYDRDISEDVAHDDAMRNAWKFETYLRAQRIHKETI